MYQCIKAYPIQLSYDKNVAIHEIIIIMYIYWLKEYLSNTLAITWIPR